MSDRDGQRSSDREVLDEISASPRALARFLEGYSGSEDPIELLQARCHPDAEADTRPACGTAADNERIVFGPGHSDDDVAVAAAALREAYASRRASAAALEEGIRRYGSTTSEIVSTMGVPSAGDVAEGSHPRRRTWLLLAAGCVSGAAIAGAGIILADLGSTGDAVSAPREGAAAEARTYSSHPLEGEQGDARFGARQWFDVAQTPIDELPNADGTVDPASTRYVGSAGTVRVWVGQDEQSGYCVVTSPVAASADITETCVTPAQFHQSGNNVLADEVYIRWQGESVDLTVLPRD